MEDLRQEGPQNLILEGRDRLSVTGVTEVISFDEHEVVMETSRGLLTVSGEEIHVEKLTLEVGELVLAGRIDAMLYTDEGRNRQGGFWSRFF